MLQSPHLSNPIASPYTFKFDCDINFDPNRRDVGFEVRWLFNGKPDPNVPNTVITDGTTRTASLDQAGLKGHLNQEVWLHKRCFHHHHLHRQHRRCQRCRHRQKSHHWCHRFWLAGSSIWLTSIIRLSMFYFAIMRLVGKVTRSVMSVSTCEWI